MSVTIPDGSHWWGIDAEPSPLKVVWSLILATTPSLLLVLPIKASSFRQPVSRKEADILWSASKPQYTVRDVRYFLNWTFLPSLALSYYCDHPLTFCWLYLIIIIIIKFWPPIFFLPYLIIIIIFWPLTFFWPYFIANFSLFRCILSPCCKIKCDVQAEAQMFQHSMLKCSPFICLTFKFEQFNAWRSVIKFNTQCELLYIGKSWSDKINFW